MSRVTTEEVKEIIQTNMTDLTPFINVANILVTQKLGASDLDADTLKEIERWLSAHFVSMKERQPISESIGSASMSYAGAYGKGIDETTYGRTAKALDTTGALASAFGRKVVLEAI